MPLPATLTLTLTLALTLALTLTPTLALALALALEVLLRSPRQHLRGVSCVDWRAPPQGRSEEYYRTPQRSPEEVIRQAA
jgi:hypothetical protein